MGEHDDFLRAILAQPEDTAPRLVYADWLDERDDPRGPYVRLHTELLTAAKARAGAIRKQLEAMETNIPLVWLAFMETLGLPFVYEDYGYDEAEFPLAESLGNRGRLVTFESQWNSADYDDGLLDDLIILYQLSFGAGTTYYGASDFVIEPFMCRLPAQRRPLFAQDILDALQAHIFASEHIRSLEATQVPFPGYHPHTDNDEIHNDFAEQNLFGHGNNEADDPDTTHGYLLQNVLQKQLWYVLLHPQRDANGLASIVFLFAVGCSKNGDRLIGVVSQQVCHNLCD